MKPLRRFGITGSLEFPILPGLIRAWPDREVKAYLGKGEENEANFRYSHDVQ